MNGTRLLAAAAAVGVACLTGGVVANTLTINAKDARISQLQSDVSGMQSEVSALQTRNASLMSGITQAEQRLNAASTTGDVITCADLRQIYSQAVVSVYGTDSLGTSMSSTGGFGNSWVPQHCYKP